MSSSPSSATTTRSSSTRRPTPPGRASRPPRTRPARSVTPPLRKRHGPTPTLASATCATATCSTNRAHSGTTPTSLIGSRAPPPAAPAPASTTPHRHRDNSSLPAATPSPDKTSPPALQISRPQPVRRRPHSGGMVETVQANRRDPEGICTVARRRRRRTFRRECRRVTPPRSFGQRIASASC